jgi:hypothetical protein
MNNLGRKLAAALLSGLFGAGIPVSPAAAQFQCPAGVPLFNGGAMVCQCPDGSYAGLLTGCPVRQPPPMPTFNPNQQLQHPDNVYNNAVTRELEWLGGVLSKNPFQPNAAPDNQPLANNKTVSAALQQMLTSKPLPAPPTNYQDPFEPAVSTNKSSPSPPVTSTPAASAAPANGTVVNDNLRDVGTMQMQPPPAQQNGESWQNPDPYNTHCTGAFKC